MIEHRGDQTVADTAGMQILTNRPAHAIRILCERGADGLYDADACERTLKAEPRDPVVLTAVEAEAYLGIPANRIYQWAFQGWIRPVDRVGRSPRYRVDELHRMRNRDERRAQLDL